MKTAEEFIEQVKRGMDWGRAKFIVQWQSEDKKCFILTRTGYSCWSGVGQPHDYCKSAHYLIDLTKIDNKRIGWELLWEDNVVDLCEGRLLKSKKQEWIDKINTKLKVKAVSNRIMDKFSETFKKLAK